MGFIDWLVGPRNPLATNTSTFDFGNKIGALGNFLNSIPLQPHLGYAPPIDRSPATKTSPPPISSPMYDEGSRFKEARDQASSLDQGDMPSLASIMAKLQALQDPSRYSMDPQSLIQQARAQAAAQYDPIIAQLKGQESSAESRANRNKSELGSMFNQLSSSLQGDIPGIQQNFTDAKQKTQQNYDQLDQKIDNTYDQTQADQESMLKRLGIEAAAPDILPNQMRDKAFFTNSANQEGQTAQTALDTESRGNQEYTRRGSEMAQTEGVQRQGDLMSKLQDTLAAFENQIGANETAKSQAFTAGLGQLQNQSQQQAMQYSQRDFDNYLKSISMGRDLNNDALSQLAKGQVTKTSSPADVAGRALTLGLGQNDAQSIQDAFNNAVASDSTILSGLNADSGTAAPKEALASRVVQKGREMGLSQQQLNALQTIALEYFGRA
jgi:hypothetical protein